MKKDIPCPGYRVGITYNVKRGVQSEVEDIEAEYDSMETIYSIKKALEKLNCTVELMEAEKSLLDCLAKTKVDIVFNIAEGRNGRGREAHIPAIMNFLGIPFTGSDETTLAIALDKNLTKQIVASYGIKTPRSQVIQKRGDKLDHTMKFPLIIKPNSEGSSKGISELSVVSGLAQLEDTIENNMSKYQQPMLIEEFIEGREFTVGIIGNDDETVVFPPMEIKFKSSLDSYKIYSYQVKKNYQQYVEYVCPAELDPSLNRKMTSIARRIYSILGCKDFARLDFRLSNDGEVYFIEINPLPGLAPGYSDYPMIAQFTGIEYDRLIGMILNSALKRYSLPTISI